MIKKLYKIAEGLNTRFPDGNESYKIVTRLAEECGEVAAEVNHLTLDDLDLLESAPEGFHAGEFGDLRTLLSEGIVACGIVSNEIVGMAYTAGRAGLYSEIGAFTLEKWQGQGFASVAGSIVAWLIQKDGQIPVWSTG